MIRPDAAASLPALLLGCAAFLLAAACIHVGPPVPVHAHLSWPEPELLDPNLPRLGVGPFHDARADELREGVRPELFPGWLGLYREGDHRTGDAQFVGELANGLREDARATLARTGDFSQVRALDLDPATLEGEALAAALAQAEVDFLLVATLEEFVGIQHQSFSFSPTSAGWVRNRFAPPVGRVAASYRLFGPEGLVWSKRIATEYESPSGSIAQAALDAMAISNETLAQRVHGFVAADRLRQARVVPLRIFDGCALGRKASAALVAEASRVFGREIGLVFRPEYQVWQPPDARWHPAPLLDALSALAPPTGGVAIGIAPFGNGQRLGLPDDRFGLAHAFGDHAIAGCDENHEVRALTVIHELGHLLGAVHVRERASVMHPVAEFDARFFDAFNRRILATARERRFGEPIPARTAGRLRAIYRAASRFPDEVLPDDLEIVQAALERAASPELGE